MYQNGRRVKGYSKKRLHKRKMKDKFAKTWFYGAGSGSWTYIKTAYENGQFPDWYRPLDYWRVPYFSGCRKYSKYCTKRRMRQIARQLARQARYDDVEDMGKLPQNNEYHKLDDYGWRVW